MGTIVPVLIGAEGLSAGEPFVLSYDAPVTIGRSRECEVSMQKLRQYLALSDAERAACKQINSVSRKHLRLTVSGTIARLENLSPNGSWCDEARFDQAKAVDLAHGQVVVRVSATESFALMLIETQELERLIAKTQLINVPSTRLDQPKAPPAG